MSQAGHIMPRLSRARTLVILTSCLFELVFFGGTIFGWASLAFVLREEGIFSTLCDQQGDNGTEYMGLFDYIQSNYSSENVTLTSDLPCVTQEKMLSLVFTVGMAFFGLTSFPVGFIFDRLGLRFTRVFAALTGAVGYLLLAFADKEFPWILFPGIACVSTSCITMILTNSYIGRMAGEKSSTIITLYAGSISSSVVVFLMVKLLHDVGINSRWVLIFLASLWLPSLAITCILLPGNDIFSNCCKRSNTISPDLHYKVREIRVIEVRGQISDLKEKHSHGDKQTDVKSENSISSGLRNGKITNGISDNERKSEKLSNGISVTGKKNGISMDTDLKDIDSQGNNNRCEESVPGGGGGVEREGGCGGMSRGEGRVVEKQEQVFGVVGGLNDGRECVVRSRGKDGFQNGGKSDVMNGEESRGKGQGGLGGKNEVMNGVVISGEGEGHHKEDVRTGDGGYLETGGIGGVNKGDKDVLDKKPKPTGGVPDVVKAMFSPMYLLYIYWYCALHVQIQMYISEYNSWVSSMVDHDMDKVSHFTNVLGYAMMFSIVISPLGGVLIDSRRKMIKDLPGGSAARSVAALPSLIVAGISAVSLSLLFYVSRPNLIYFVVIMGEIFRSFFYATGVALLELSFSPAHYGRLFGLARSIGGISSFIQFPYILWANVNLAGYISVHIFLLVTVLLSWLLPVYILYLYLKQRRLPTDKNPDDIINNTRF